MVAVMQRRYPDIAWVGFGLKDLRTARNQADYNLSKTLEFSIAQSWMNAALKIAEILDETLTTPEVQSAITQSIREYETNVLKQSTWHS